MPKIKFDRGIPIPPKAATAAAIEVDKMRVGDSFKMPDTQANRMGVYNAAKAQGFKITIRKDGSKFRVWRIS